MNTASGPQAAGNIADSGLSHVFDLQTNPRTGQIITGAAVRDAGTGVSIPAGAPLITTAAGQLTNNGQLTYDQAQAMNTLYGSQTVLFDTNTGEPAPLPGQEMSPTFARWYQTYATNNKNRQSAFIPNGQCSFTYEQFASFYAGSYIKDPESVQLAIQRTCYNRVTGLGPDFYSPEDAAERGQIFFWIEFGIQAVMFSIFLILTLRREEHKRRFHYITTLYSGISTMAYYCMARGQGSVALFDTWSNGDFSPYRVFYYARYIDWFLTVPLIILNLCLLASATKALTIGLCLSGMLMVGTGLMGALSITGTKWGWFGISNMCFLPIVVAWVTVLRKNAREKSPEVEKTYNILIIISIIAWFAYPIIWIIATGTHAISLAAEIVSYAVVDTFSKALFGVILLFSRSAIEDASFKDPEKMKLPTSYTSSTIYSGVLSKA